MTNVKISWNMFKQVQLKHITINKKLTTDEKYILRKMGLKSPNPELNIF